MPPPRPPSPRRRSSRPASDVPELAWFAWALLAAAAVIVGLSKTAIPGAGHILAEEKPVEVVDVILRMHRSVTPLRRD